MNRRECLGPSESRHGKGCPTTIMKKVREDGVARGGLGDIFIDVLVA